MSLTEITRDGYQLLDVFSDVGGLSTALLSGIKLLLRVWNLDFLDSYLSSKLFKSSDTIDGDD